MFTWSNLWFVIRWFLLAPFSYVWGLGLYLVILLPRCDFGWCAGGVEYSSALLSGIVIGGLIGLFQHLVIRKTLPEGENWFGISAIGWTVLYALLFTLEAYAYSEEYEAKFAELFISFPVILMGIGSLGGLAISWLQWRTILTTNFSRSIIWIPLSVLGIFVGQASGIIFFSGLLFVDALLMGLTYSLVTGITFAYLWGRGSRRSSEVEAPG
jgi:hypothetical protein